MRGTFKKLTEKGNRKNTVWRGEIAHSYAWGPTARNLWGRWPLRQRNLDLSRYKWYSKKAFVKGSFQSLLKAVPSYLTIDLSASVFWMIENPSWTRRSHFCGEVWAKWSLGFAEGHSFYSMLLPCTSCSSFCSFFFFVCNLFYCLFAFVVINALARLSLGS